MNILQIVLSAAMIINCNTSIAVDSTQQYRAPHGSKGVISIERYIGRNITQHEKDIIKQLTKMHNKIAQYGNLLVFEKNHPNETVILQSGIATNGARKLQTKLQQQNIPGRVMSGLEVIFSISPNNQYTVDAKLQCCRQLNNRPPQNTSQYKDILLCILQDIQNYVEIVSQVVKKQYTNPRKKDNEDNTFVGSPKGNKLCNGMLKTIMQKSPKEQWNVLYEILEILGYNEPDEARIENSAIHIDSSNSTNIVTALMWLKRALHTEIQLAVLLNIYNLTAPGGISLLMSVCEPCSSCEQGAPLLEWYKNGIRFLSTKKDSSGHSYQLSGLRLYNTVDLTNPPRQDNATIFINVPADMDM